MWISVLFHVYETLKDSLRDQSLSIDSFRRQLKTFLFDIIDPVYLAH